MEYSERYSGQVASDVRELASSAEAGTVKELRRLRERLARVEALIVVGSRFADGSPVYLDVRGRDLVEALREG
jgi:hypothetical protein